MTTSLNQAEEERDINDLFHDIALTEEHIKQQGYEEGITEGQLKGNQEGYQLGYSQGVQLGQEIGEIYGTVVAHQQLLHTEKVLRTLQQLREAIEQFPRDNNPDKDIIGSVEHIRTLNKRVRAIISTKSMKKLTGDGNTAAKEVKKDFSF